MAFANQRADDILLDDAPRLGRADHAPPAAPGVLLHDPPELCCETMRGFLVHIAADRLGGISQGRIVAVHQHLGDDGHHLAAQSAALEFVVERALEHVTDRALRIGIGKIDRHFRNDALGKPRAAQDEADLRAVTVGQDHRHARLDHVGDVMRGLRRGLALIRNRLVLLVGNQGVATHRDDGGPASLGHEPFLSVATIEAA